MGGGVGRPQKAGWGPWGRGRPGAVMSGRGRALAQVDKTGGKTGMPGPAGGWRDAAGAAGRNGIRVGVPVP